MIQRMPIAKTLLSGRRILVAQGDPALADRTASAIAGAGGRVVGPYVRVADCMAYLAGPDGRVDAAAIDLQLRDDGAYRVADRLRRSGVPLLFVRSGFVEVTARFRTCPVLTRPITDHQLVQTLVRLLDPAALIVEARASA